ncbi:hypothetical protein Peur_054713 [Populus x canadensis]
MDSKISEILEILRRHFSCIHDSRHIPGLKFRISCHLRSEPFNHIWGDNSPTSQNDDICSQIVSLDTVPVENDSREKESCRAPVTIDLEPREPIPGLVDFSIEANAENGQVIHCQLQSIIIVIRCSREACGSPSNIGRETFQLKWWKCMAANSRARSVKLLEVPADFLIQASEQYLAPFVVSVIGEPLVNMIKDGGIIRNIIWKGSASDSFLDSTTSATALERGPLHLTYGDDRDGSGS